jgi:cytochrome c biogenesis protein CcdA
MKEKIVQFIAGLLIYFIFGVVMILIAGKSLSEQWGFIAIWTVGMALVHTFVMEPLRVKLTKRRATQQKK